MDDDLEELLAFAEAEEGPYTVDRFEEELARRLGIQRGPGVDQVRWREIRREFIGAHPQAKAKGKELQEEFLVKAREWDRQNRE